ncbi:MAG: hypothetical protein WC554_07705 [Clostridia bacterium]|jgi:hypothetical protein
MASSEKKINGFSEYQIEDAARTLIRAEEIRNDKKLFPLAQKELVKQAQAAADAAVENKVSKKLKETF